MDKIKKCPKCNKYLSYIYFSKGSSLDGLQSYCKKCIKERNRSKNPIVFNNDVKSLKGELWKDIIGYEYKYQVSNLGRVKSLDRKNIDALGRIVFLKGKLLKNNENKKNGYLSVMLGYKGKRKYIHRLVLEAFVLNIENKPCINHKNKNKKDNSLINLEWCTYLENNLHSKSN